jgi:hypothetical protein
LLAAAVLTAAGGFAQHVKEVVPLGAQAADKTPAAAADDDPGRQVEMFENPNLDRHLRKAQSFLDRSDFGGAIGVLQDVIEGRTIEVVVADGEPSATPVKPPAPQRGQNGVAVTPDGSAQRAAPQPRASALDARNSVFSADGRLYRPVRRLCHELLSRMPAVGIELYRATHEVAAEELLAKAHRDGATAGFEQVANRYFVTLAAGRAMAELADRLMHEGRHRAAVQVLRDLLEVYPAENRKRLGVSESWCRFKIALCLRLAGEADAAGAAVGDLASRFADESLRLEGELVTIKDLPTSELFARDLRATPGVAAADDCWLNGERTELIPLWQYRFRNPEPYKEPKSTNPDRVIFDTGATPTTMPYASRYGPATWVAFSDDGDHGGHAPRALFLEHFRLRLADAGTGVMIAQGLTNGDRPEDEPEEPPQPRDNQPRVRYAANDNALLRPVEDETRRYVVLGQPRASSSIETLKVSQLVAYRRDLQQREWSSSQWLEGDGGLRDVTFLAAPAVFGERLLLPALRRGAYTLECLDRRTGQPLWHTPLHGGGTPFFKAPGTQVVVQSGIAYVATNAGCLAAVDAFAGDLRWVRRYERADPLRRKARTQPRGRSDMMGNYQPPFAHGELTGFLPNDLLARDGLIVIAPCDGEMLLCIDGATGEPVWMLDAVTRYASYGPMRTLIGADADTIYVATDNHVVAVGLAGGLIRWACELPPLNGPKSATRGRGALVGNQVVMPGQRELLVVATDGKSVAKKVPLPAFDSSRDPLVGSFNVVVDGAWLAVGYQGGVEVFSAAPALLRLADTTADPLHRANYLLRAGQSERAVTALSEALAAAPAQPMRLELAKQLLAVVQERAAEVARGGDLAAAMSALDAIQARLVDRDVRLHWHLARLEICKQFGDLRAHEREQQRLYDYMEGKG